MPKSKRKKLISLTKVVKNPKERKERLIANIRDSCDAYKFIFVYDIFNQRNERIKELRAAWKDSRFFFAKNKVMQVALGRSPEDEHNTDLHRVSEMLVGNCGLLFTNRAPEEVIKFFAEYQVKEFARSGFKATEAIKREKGVLEEFTHSMEPHLRKLGLPTQLKDGKVELRQDFTICEEGERLTPERAKILELLGIKMSTFYVHLKCYWSGSATPRVTILDGETESKTVEEDAAEES